MKKFRVFYTVNANLFSDIFDAVDFQHALQQVELIYDCYDSADVFILSVRPCPSPKFIPSPIPVDIFSGDFL